MLDWGVFVKLENLEVEWELKGTLRMSRYFYVLLGVLLFVRPFSLLQSYVLIFLLPLVSEEGGLYIPPPPYPTFHARRLISISAQPIHNFSLPIT